MPQTPQQAGSNPRSSRSRSRTGVEKTNSSVSIIGAGRVGTALGIALKRAGYRIEIVATKHHASARRAAQLIGDKSVGVSAARLNRPSPKLLERLSRSTVVLIATPDDNIAETASRLADALRSTLTECGNEPTHQVALHTSGALSATVLQPLRQVGFATGSLHPLLSISDPVAGADSLRDAFFAVEGEPAAVRLARSIIRNLGARAFVIKPQAKALYHAAALTASPNLIALFDIALETLGRCGLSRQQARKMLLPLVRSTLANLTRQDPAQALTGPFKRGDATTVQKHIAAMKSAGLHDALALYALLGRHSLRLVKTQDKKFTGLDEVARILSSALADCNRKS